MVFEEMFAELSFILLLQSVELSLISVEVIVVWLLCKVSHHFTRWVVKVSWPSLCVVTLTLISRLLTWRGVVLALGVSTKHGSIIWRLSRIICSFVQVNVLSLLWCLRIWSSLLLLLSFFSLIFLSWRLLGLFFFFVLLRSVAYHFSRIRLILIIDWTITLNRLKTIYIHPDKLLKRMKFGNLYWQF